MHVSTLHFLSFVLVLAVVPVVALHRLAKAPARARWPVVANWVVGPILIALIWLHGVWFDPPNNWAMLDELGFFGFWFKPHRNFEYEEGRAFFLLLSVPALGIAASGALVAALGMRRSRGTRINLAAFLLAVVAALFLHRIPDALVDAHHHRPYALAPDRILEDLLGDLAPALLFAIPLLAADLVLTGLSLRKRSS